MFVFTRRRGASMEKTKFGEMLFNLSRAPASVEPLQFLSESALISLKIVLSQSGWAIMPGVLNNATKNLLKSEDKLKGMREIMGYRRFEIISQWSLKQNCAGLMPSLVDIACLAIFQKDIYVSRINYRVYAGLLEARRGDPHTIAILNEKFSLFAKPTEELEAVSPGYMYRLWQTIMDIAHVRNSSKSDM